MMTFCECGGILINTPNGMKCRTCGKVFRGKSKKIAIANHKHKDITVIEDNKPDLPVTEKICPKCGHDEAYFWLIQTRSADEPPTQFFRCTKCKHVWREYK
ncbi:MAG: transcription factor S [Candidatus Aenigmatarchaeota archaeon]